MSRYWDYFQPSKPREAQGGIKAQNQRGAFGQSWWAKRWIEALENLDLGARLGRGRSYARKGQVLSIDIDKGIVKASVQGSRATPYRVKIRVDELSPDEWKTVLDVIAKQALYAARLLAGEMPQDIETIFTQAKVSLFPTKKKDLTTDCSCPDWSNPCKHIAAVYYLLGEELDRDPFLLFTLRGLRREEMLEQLGARGAQSIARKEQGLSSALPPEPLPTDISQFWSGAELPPEHLNESPAAPAHAALLKRLGAFPFWRGQERFLEVLAPIYERAAQQGLEILASTGDRKQ